MFSRGDGRYPSGVLPADKVFLRRLALGTSQLPVGH